MRAGQRHRHRHAEHWRRAWVVVCGERDCYTGFNEPARVGILRQAEKVICPGDESCYRFASGEGWQIGIVYVVHVVERGGLIAKNGPESCFAELTHMCADGETVSFRSRENLRG